MIFDQPPAELPVATLRPRDSGAQLLLDVREWFLSKGRWLRPRAIPVAAAFAGMLAVLASASYLRELAYRQPEQLPAPVLSTTRADEPFARIRVDSNPAGAGTFVAKPLSVTIDGKPVEPKNLKLEPGVYRVNFEPRVPTR